MAKGIKKTIAISSLTFLVLLGCGEGSQYYKESHSFSDHSWELKETPTFKVDIKDTSETYDFNFILRTSTDFAYSNLWVFLTTTLPDGKSERRPYEFKITDDKGRWLGNSTGTVVETPMTFAQMKLPKPGTYQFKVEQGITIPKVKEVIDLTLTINPSTAKNRQ